MIFVIYVFIIAYYGYNTIKVPVYSEYYRVNEILVPKFHSLELFNQKGERGRKLFFVRTVY